MNRLHLFDLTDAARGADERLNSLPKATLNSLAAEAQRRTSARGLRRGPQDIPLVLSPISLPREELTRLGHAARLIVSALVKVARELIDRRPEKAQLLFSHLSPLELAALQTRSREAEELLLARVDWFVAKDGTPHALEVNATIPAMPVYSDAAVAGFLEAICPGRAAALTQQNPSNAQWVLDALLRAAQAAGRGKPGLPFPQGLVVQLLHREGDPQLSELEQLAALLQARGIAARTVTPADIVLDGAPERVLYRHLFARYVEPQSALGQAFLDPLRHGMWNRVDGWLETKGLFAELSAHVGAGGALLTAEERACVEEMVPFTRLLDEVSDAQLGDGDNFVLKKSHDYGGKSVVIGREAGPAAFQTALGAARSDPPGTWVAQVLVDAPSLPRFLCQPGVGGAVVAKRLDLHLDVSTYASLIPGVGEGGSVCRAAPGRVVNIVGGGGVAPLFADDVLAAALEAWTA